MTGKSTSISPLPEVGQMSEQPDVDPDGTGLRDHAAGDHVPEQSDAAITDDLPDAEGDQET
jgi:hypothetical protein